MDYDKPITMSPEEMLAHLLRLRDECAERSGSRDWSMEFLYAKLALEMYVLEPMYDNVKDSTGPVELLELNRPLTERDRACIKEAGAVKRQIHKCLRGMKKARAEAV